jgi:hypothetical protein
MRHSSTGAHGHIVWGIYWYAVLEGETAQAGLIVLEAGVQKLKGHQA